MNVEYFIAKKIFSDKANKSTFIRPIITIAVIGIALGLAVMILSIAVVTGFKKQISDKIIGFGSHIQILNFDNNSTYETKPVSKNQHFYPSIENLEGIKHIQVFATKPGIIKTKTDIQGVVLKGIDTDYDWSFFKNYLIDGNIFQINDSIRINKALISKYLASLLKLKTGESFNMYFAQNPPRMRKFVIEGIYETSLEE
ncbi:MAG: ABC transporter permease, partial [Bacteroidales bacterium]|nr:ABC transporter permease [Bacteroidales bacterium]